MTNAMTLSALGMINDIRQMDIISQNIANANTNGYKRDLPVSGSNAFPDELASVLLGMTQGSMPLQTLQNSLPLPRVQSVLDGSQGALRFTGNPLDVAIEGDGFFELSTAEGTRFTRHGAFKLDVGGRLVTANGDIVNGVGGEIRLLNGSPKIDKQGRLFDGEDMVGQLKIVRFDDMTKLHRLGGGLYRSDAAAEPVVSAYQGVRQGHLEASNVDAMEEMVRMIETSRHFEMSQKVITGYDEMIGQAISTIAEF